MLSNLPPGTLTFSAADKTFDLSVYEDLNEFLADVWSAAFEKYDATLPTSAAAYYAIRAQDRAEIFWRYHIEGLEYVGGRFVSAVS